MNLQSFYWHLKGLRAQLRGLKLTSVLSLEQGALLPLLAVSLAGTTVICCTGMLLFLGNAPVLHPQISQHTGPSRPSSRVPTCDLLSHPRAVFRERRRCSGITLLYEPNPIHGEERRWNMIRSPWQQEDSSGDSKV